MYGFSPNFQDVKGGEDLELIRFCQVSGNNYCHGNTFKILGSLWVVHSINQCMDFHQIFICICLPQEDLQLINIWRVSGNSCCHSNALNTFGLKTSKFKRGHC